jgi:hypothetical protein
MLVSTARNPDFELLKGHCFIFKREKVSAGVAELLGVKLIIELSLYLYPKDDGKVFVPGHRCFCILSSVSQDTSLHNRELFISSPRPDSCNGILRLEACSGLIESTSNDLIVHGPGSFNVHAEKDVSELPGWFNVETIRLDLNLHVVNSPISVNLNISMDQRDSPPSPSCIGSWEFTSQAHVPNL